MMYGSSLAEVELRRGEALTIVPMHRPLIPFLKEPWSSRSKYPAIMLETFLYGVFCVLFACCFFTLVRQKSVKKTIVAASTLLFALATADILITGYFFFHFVLNPAAGSTPSPTSKHETWNQILEIKFGFYVVANAVASSLLISRCYAVWKNKRIVIAPIALLICGTLISFVSLTDSHLGDRLLAASFITSAAANLSVTLLIATRIWWTSRKIRGDISWDIPAVLECAVVLLVDSGALYSFSIFLYLVSHTLVIDASLTQIAGVTLSGLILRKASCEALGEGSVYTSTATLPEISVVVDRVQSLPRPNLNIRTSFLVNRPQRSDSADSGVMYK